MRLPRFLDGDLGAVWWALLAVLGWRLVATLGAASRGAVLESLVMTVLALLVAGLALLPLALAVRLRGRLGLRSRGAHLAGLAGFAALHLPLWWLDRATILGDPGFFDRFMLLLGGVTAGVALASHAHILQREGRIAWPSGPLLASGTALTACVVLAATLLPASAHTPAFDAGPARPGEPLAVPDGGASWALMQRLEPGDVQVFALDLPAGARLEASLSMLATEGALGSPFRPLLAAVGPGLPPAGPGGALPVEVPEGHGVLLSPGWGGRGHEGFTDVPVLRGPSLRAEAPEAGRYLLVVWDPGGGGGEVWVGVGHEERLGLAELHVFPAAWLEVRSRFWPW